jgi:1-acyl-sn-glycerol-3-phosphate acyltransferase
MAIKVDIRGIIKARSGKTLPGFIARPLERLIHQQELNEVLEQLDGLDHKQTLDCALSIWRMSCTPHFTVPLDKSERYILASNHPFGGLDGMLLLQVLQREWEDVGAIVNNLLQAIAPLAPYWVPINKFGRQNSQASQIYDAALSSETKQILTFPAGACSRPIDGKITDTEWKFRFIKDAAKYKRKIVPVYVEGQLSWRFYTLYRLRKFFGVGVNIEQGLLVDEMFRQQGKHIRVVFGAPIDVESLEGTFAEKALEVRRRAYELQHHLK